MSSGAVPSEPTREELEATIRDLRSQIARLREELRLVQRDRHETPPHYL